MSIPSNISFVQKAIISFCLLAKALWHCIAGCQDSFRNIFCHFSARSRRSGTAWMHSYLQSGGTFQTFQSPTKYNIPCQERAKNTRKLKFTKEKPHVWLFMQIVSFHGEDQICLVQKWYSLLSWSHPVKVQGAFHAEQTVRRVCW